MTRWGAAIGLSAVLVFSLQECPARKPVESRPSLVLKENEIERVVFDGRTRKLHHLAATHGRHHGNDHRSNETRLSGVRGVSVSLTKDGTLDATAETKGWLWGPGAVCGFGDRVRGGIDYELAFYKDASLLTGVTTDSQMKIRLHVAGAYRVYGNTHAFAGVDHKGETIFGIRVAF